MNKYPRTDYFVIILAYIHRYVFPICIVVIPSLLADTKEGILFGAGICCVLFALYTFLGYKLHWKHIYCSYQNANHQKMTPEHTYWDQIKKSDAYGVPIIFSILGIAAIIIYIFHLE